MKPGWVYILVGRTGTLYIGVTNNLDRRMQEYRTKFYPGFTAKYDCNKLVFYERYEDIAVAIGREKQMKGWTRKKKIMLVTGVNPEWKDLAEDWGNPYNASRDTLDG